MNKFLPHTFFALILGLGPSKGYGLGFLSPSYQITPQPLILQSIGQPYLNNPFQAALPSLFALSFDHPTPNYMMAGLAGYAQGRVKPVSSIPQGSAGEGSEGEAPLKEQSLKIQGAPEKLGGQNSQFSLAKNGLPTIDEETEEGEEEDLTEEERPCPSPQENRTKNLEKIIEKMDK